MFDVDLHHRVVRKAVFWVSAAFIAATFAGQAQAANPFLILDIPGAGASPNQGTYPAAINGDSVIVGSYVDSQYVYHGFIGPAMGPIATFNAPGAGSSNPSDGTLPTAINASGTVTGYYVDRNSTGFVGHGFVRKSDGSFEAFDVATDTMPTGINDRDVVVGRAFPYGFVRKPTGQIRKFSVPGATNTIGTSINNRGVIAGYYSDSSNVTHGFVRAHNGTMTTFDIPSGFDHVVVDSINAAGDVTGYAFNNTTARGFLRTADGTITVFNPSDCPQTYATGINAGGTIVGYCYADSDSVYHGFTREPDGTITTYSAPGAGTGVGTGTYPIAISPGGKTVGYTKTNSLAVHGFRLNAQGP